MIIETTLSARRAKENVEVVIDTGYEGGLLLPSRLAKAIGCTFVKAQRLPKGPDGKKIEGRMTVVTVLIRAANISVEVPAFVPKAGQMPDDEVLLGEYCLAQMKASLIINDTIFRFPRVNPYGSDWNDMGDIVIRTRPRWSES